MFYIAIVRVYTRPYIRIKMLTRNNFVNAGLLFLVAMLFFVFVSDDSEAATYTVDKFGGSDYTNITQAVTMPVLEIQFVLLPELIMMLLK